MSILNKWKEEGVGEQLKLLSGFPFPSNKFSSDEGFPLIRIRDIVGSKIETYYMGNILPMYIIKKGDVLIGMDGDFNLAKWNSQDALLNQRVLKVDVLDPNKLNADFIYYWLQPYVKKVNELTTATTVKHLSTKDIRKARAKIPTLAAQKRIGLILNTIDRTITHTEALIEKYQQIKAGLMHDLFTRGIGADGKLRPPRDKAPELYQESSIGWIPKEWQLELLDRLAQRGSGHTPNKNIGGYWNGGVKWVSLADSRKLDKLYISDTDLEISELGIQNSSANIHPSGTVIMTRDAGVGKSAIISEPMAVSQHFMAWRCAEKMNNYFLYYWLQYKKRMFENVAMGSTIVTIGLPYFKRLKIATPISIIEQTIISEKLRSKDTHIFSLKSELEKLKYKKSGLMHDLLTGTVQVNSDPV
jgi:type I restriction enzyme, S subunit